MTTLHVIEGPLKGQSFELKGDVFIGRSSDNDIQINDGTVSRRHLKILRIGEMSFVEDLKSTNGTYINGELIVPGKGFEVGEEDRVSIGNSVVCIGEMSPHSDGKTVLSKEYEEDSLAKERRTRSLDNLALVNKVSELLKQSLSIDEILEKVLETLLDTLPRIDRAAILQFDSQKGQISKVVAKSRQDQGGKGGHYSRTVAQRVVENGEPVRMSNTTYEMPADFSENMDTLSIRSVLCVPMIMNSKTCGAIYVDSLRGPYGFRDEDHLLLNCLTGPVAVAIENARLAAKLEELQAT